VPVEEAFNWNHGIITKGASLESETTAAALGKSGIRKINPMANLAFLSITLGRYVKNNLYFGAMLSHPPKIFSANYFLKGRDGKFLNERQDKRVWLKWMELRVHNDVTALETPTGLIPRYDDLKKLFKDVLGKEYSEEAYKQEFTVRIPENLSRIERVVEFYKAGAKDAPEVLFEVLKEQSERLKEAKKAFGDYIAPGNFKEKK
jgi:phosphoenolpyruvate carboxykinase (GTP)